MSARERNPKPQAPHKFYVGETEKIEQFYRAAFAALSARFLHKLTNQLVNLAESKDTNKEIPSAWWPAEVKRQSIYRLTKDNLVRVLIHLLRQHRRVDIFKRELDWVALVKGIAENLLQKQCFSFLGYSNCEDYREKQRIWYSKNLLPRIFTVAQMHQDYVKKHDLYEGSGKKDPKNGQKFTWEDNQILFRYSRVTHICECGANAALETSKSITALAKSTMASPLSYTDQVRTAHDSGNTAGTFVANESTSSLDIHPVFYEAEEQPYLSPHWQESSNLELSCENMQWQDASNLQSQDPSNLQWQDASNLQWQDASNSPENLQWQDPSYWELQASCLSL